MPPSSHSNVGHCVLVPVVSPASAPWLAQLAARLAGPEGSVSPLSVIGLDADADHVAQARAVVAEAEAAARGAGAREAVGTVARNRSVVAAVLEAVETASASLVLMGWQGESSHRNVFGELIDSILGRSTVPLAVVRPQPHAFDRVLVPISQDHLLPGGARGVRLAGELARRLQGDGAIPVVVLRTGTRGEPLPAELTALSPRVHHDPRPVEAAVGAAARSTDLIVTPVAPTASGLRAATTHLAWSAPDSWLLVALDVGPPPAEPLADAVGSAGVPPVAAGRDDAGGDFTVIVTALSNDAGAPDARRLRQALRLVGPVIDLRAWQDEAGRPGVTARVRLTAPSANVAVATVMTAIHDSDAVLGGEVSYEIDRG